MYLHCLQQIMSLPQSDDKLFINNLFHWFLLVGQDRAFYFYSKEYLVMLSAFRVDETFYKYNPGLVVWKLLLAPSSDSRVSFLNDVTDTSPYAEAETHFTLNDAALPSRMSMSTLARNSFYVRNCGFVRDTTTSVMMRTWFKCTCVLSSFGDRCCISFSFFYHRETCVVSEEERQL